MYLLALFVILCIIGALFLIVFYVLASPDLVNRIEINETESARTAFSRKDKEISETNSIDDVYLLPPLPDFTPVEPYPDTEPESYPESVPESYPESVPETYPESVPEAESESVPEAESEAVPESFPEKTYPDFNGLLPPPLFIEFPNSGDTTTTTTATSTTTPKLTTTKPAIKATVEEPIDRLVVPSKTSTLVTSQSIEPSRTSEAASTPFSQSPIQIIKAPKIHVPNSNTNVVVHNKQEEKEHLLLDVTVNGDTSNGNIKTMIDGVEIITHPQLPPWIKSGSSSVITTSTEIVSTTPHIVTDSVIPTQADSTMIDNVISTSSSKTHVEPTSSLASTIESTQKTLTSTTINLPTTSTTTKLSTTTSATTVQSPTTTTTTKLPITSIDTTSSTTTTTTNKEPDITTSFQEPIITVDIITTSFTPIPSPSLTTEQSTQQVIGSITRQPLLSSVAASIESSLSTQILSVNGLLHRGTPDNPDSGFSPIPVIPLLTLPRNRQRVQVTSEPIISTEESNLQTLEAIRPSSTIVPTSTLQTSQITVSTTTPEDILNQSEESFIDDPENTLDKTESGKSIIIPAQCQQRTLNYCDDVLTYSNTSLPNFVGDRSRHDRQNNFPYFQYIADSQCSNRAKEFVCSIMEPKCQIDHVLPPCRQFCAAVVEKCGDFIIETNSLSVVFNCNGYPDSNNPEVCLNLAVGEECKEGEFHCESDNTCIPEDWLCDGSRHCGQGEDEANCGFCSVDEFNCEADNQCIPIRWKCDGSVDCADRSDERDCGAPECGEGQFQCADHRKCIPDRWRCDGTNQCFDNSDELDCQGTACQNDDFQCNKSGQCVPASWRCDGVVECPDGEDEVNCPPASEQQNDVSPSPELLNRCPDGWLRCLDGTCIQFSQLCDGVSNCGDGADENNC